MNATPAPRNNGATEQVRDFGCLHYEECFAVTTDQKWLGFSCEACPVAQEKTRIVFNTIPRGQRDKYITKMTVLAAVVRAQHTDGGTARTTTVSAHLGRSADLTRKALLVLKAQGYLRERDEKWCVS